MLRPESEQDDLAIAVARLEQNGASENGAFATDPTDASRL